MAAAAPSGELALYYTGWTWGQDALDWMKSILLFFDGLAWVLPDNHCADMLEYDPVLAQPLWDAGLLHNFDPAHWLTQPIAKEIRAAADAAIVQDADHLSVITLHHLLGQGDRGWIVDRMLKRGVISARRTDLGVDMVAMPNRVRTAVLTAVALGARAAITDCDIQLVTNDERDYAIDPFMTMMSHLPIGNLRNAHVYSGDILRSDIQDVGIDLRGVPLDEILDFRRRHGPDYRRYARDLRTFCAQWAVSGPEERDTLVRDRSQEISDLAADLRKARRSLVRPASGFAVSLLGAAWTLKQGDPTGAVLAGLAAAGSLATPQTPSSAFTYLFDADDALGGR